MYKAMKKNRNSCIYHICICFCVLALMFSFMGSLFIGGQNANADSVLYVVNSGTGLTASEEDGCFSLTGTQGRGRSGMVINQPINYNTTLEFDMQLQVNNTYFEDETTHRNRQWIVTLHEYSLDDKGLPKAANNIYSGKGLYGVQLCFRAYPDRLFVSLLAQSEGKNVTISDPYMQSMLFGTEVAGVKAKPYAHIECYFADGNGNKVFQDQAATYNVKMQCYDNETGELAGEPVICSIDKMHISNEGGFTQTPYLGMFLINEAGNPVTNFDVDWKIYNIKNGLVKDFSIAPSEVVGLKIGQEVQLNPTLVPFDANADLSDIGIYYVSSNPDCVSVSNDGVLTTTRDGGESIITAMTSEGNIAEVKVVVYDEIYPELVIDDTISLPEEATQYEEIKLPKYTANDNSGRVVSSVEVVSPEHYNIDETAENYTFVPTLSGVYLVRYSAIDPMGNETIQEYDIKVKDADLSGFWSKKQTNISHIIIDENADGSTMKAEMKIGAEGVRDSSTALVWGNQPLTFTKNEDGSYNSVSFDISVNYQGISWDTLNIKDEHHNLTFYLMEAYEDGSISADAFQRGQKGMELFISQWPTASAEKPTLRFRLRTAEDATMSEQHTTVIDTYATDEESRGAADANRNNMYGAGTRYLPWFEYGDALDFAYKYLAGEKFTVKVEYFDETVEDPEGKENVGYSSYYKWTFDGFSFCVPAHNISYSDDGYRRQAFIGFKAETTNGEANYTIEISNVRNGQTRNVEFEEDNIVCELGETYQLNPKAMGYDGNAQLSDFNFKSSDESIATVDVNGKVTIVGYGEVSISAISTIENKQAVVTIGVDIPMFMLARDEYTVKLGKDFIFPIITGTDKQLPYELVASDPYGLVALENGHMQAVKIGDYTVVARYLNYEVSCVIHVVENMEEIPIIDNEMNSSSNNSENSVGCSSAISTLSISIIALMAVSSFVFIKKRKDEKV